MQYYTGSLIGLEIQISQLLFKLHILWFSECRCLSHLVCAKFKLLFWCTPVALVSLWCLSRVTLVPRRCLCRMLRFRCKFQRCGREPGTFLFRAQHLSFDPVVCWFIIALIICYTLHWCTLYNVVISPLSSISH